MCLKHDGFRATLTTSIFHDIHAVIIDEAHCIAQWGGDFRTAYSEIQKLRAFFPPSIPFYATTATLTPPALQEVHTQLAIDPEKSFYLNLGNDRPNIAYSVCTLKSAHDYNALKPLLTRRPSPSTPDDLVKTIVFVNTVAAMQIGARTIHSWFPRHLHPYIVYIHAHRSPRARRRAMHQFRNGKTHILIATEAAGMVSNWFSLQNLFH
jgi:bloom syndrome protein